eukprot:3038372-Prorocentrum_lima.AAC.1
MRASWNAATEGPVTWRRVLNALSSKISFRAIFFERAPFLRPARAATWSPAKCCPNLAAVARKATP